MTMDQLINVLVPITLIEMMVAIGLGVSFAELAVVAGNWRLVTKVALANYLCVPGGHGGLVALVSSCRPDGHGGISHSRGLPRRTLWLLAAPSSPRGTWPPPWAGW